MNHQINQTNQNVQQNYNFNAGFVSGVMGQSQK